MMYVKIIVEFAKLLYSRTAGLLLIYISNIAVDNTYDLLIYGLLNNWTEDHKQYSLIQYSVIQYSVIQSS